MKSFKMSLASKLKLQCKACIQKDNNNKADRNVYHIHVSSWTNSLFKRPSTFGILIRKLKVRESHGLHHLKGKRIQVNFVVCLPEFNCNNWQKITILFHFFNFRNPFLSFLLFYFVYKLLSIYAKYELVQKAI